MTEEYIIKKENIEEMMEKYNNQEIVNKVDRMIMNESTYNYLMVDKLIPLGMFATDVEISEEIEDDNIKVINDPETNKVKTEDPIITTKTTKHQNKYTKKYKFKGKKKNKRNKR